MWRASMMSLHRYYLEAEEGKHEIAEVAGEKVSASKDAYKKDQLVSSILGKKHQQRRFTSCGLKYGLKNFRCSFYRCPALPTPFSHALHNNLLFRDCSSASLAFPVQSVRIVNEFLSLPSIFVNANYLFPQYRHATRIS